MMENEKEIWKDIPDYEGLYKISNTGKVLSVGNIRYCEYMDRGKIRCIISATNDKYLQPKKSPRARYEGVTLCNRKGNKIYQYIHRLVAKSFLLNTNNLQEVNHKDGNSLNNHISNLEWVNKRENMTHFYKRKNNKKLSGVTYSGSRNEFSAVLHLNNLTTNLGRFKSEEEAHILYLMIIIHLKLRNKYLLQNYTTQQLNTEGDG